MISEIQVFILVLLAVAAGWYMGHRGQKAHSRDERSDFDSDYFRGLNYLLNEQPDKAIEVFCQMMEVNAETLETHFALGSLFRRRGEVDRAIRIHQNLIARPNLGRKEHTLAMLELGKDYLKAGLFDRAESLFDELVKMGAHQDAAFRHLMDIYEQEKDWAQAISSAQSLGRACPQTPLEGIHQRIANYHCEIADLSAKGGLDDTRRKHLEEALSVDADSGRGNLDKGAFHLQSGEFAEALVHYQKVVEHDPTLFPLARQALERCFSELDRAGDWLALLDRLLERSASLEVMNARIDYARQWEGAEAAEKLAEDLCSRYPTVGGLNLYMELVKSGQGDSDENSRIELLSEVLSTIEDQQPGFRCGNCGFSSRAMHWQCPSCKSWGTIKPVAGEPLV